MSDQPIHQNKDWDIVDVLHLVPVWWVSDQPIHQNKDWDIFLGSGRTSSLISQTNLSTKTRIETSLDQQSRKEALGQTNLSTKTRIETAYSAATRRSIASDQPIHQNKDWDNIDESGEKLISQVRPTYPPKQGLRHISNSFSKLWATAVRPTYPPKQGLRHLTSSQWETT